MTTHHPSSFILKQFAYGDINDQLAAMVAAHIESCPLCSQEVQEYEKNLPNLEENFSTPDLSSIADSILSAPPQKSSAHSEEVLDTDFCIQNKVIDLPYSLRTLKKRMSPWKRLNKSLITVIFFTPFHD